MVFFLALETLIRFPYGLGLFCDETGSPPGQAAPERQGRPSLIAFCCVVEHHIHEHLDTSLVALLDHGLELIQHLLAWLSFSSSLRVAGHRGKEAHCGVAPVVVPIAISCPRNKLQATKAIFAQASTAFSTFLASLHSDVTARHGGRSHKQPSGKGLLHAMIPSFNLDQILQ